MLVVMDFLRDREAFAFLAHQAGVVTRDNWFEIKAEADDETTVYIYDDIAWYGASADELVKELKDITAKQIRVRINSLGGSVFEGIAIFNALRAHPAHVITQVDSIAASIASVIVQAGDHRIVLDASEIMIHEATGVAIGATESDMIELAAILGNQTTKIAKIYAARAGEDHSKKDFLDLMRTGSANMGTWFDPADSVAQGLADEVVNPDPSDPPPDDKVVEPVASTTDFAELFNTDPDDFEWSTPIRKELV